MSRFREPGRMAVMAAVLALAVLPLTPISEFWITQLNFIGISSPVSYTHLTLPTILRV